MPRFAVVIDSPEQANAHQLIVNAPNAAESMREGARRAIRADRLGGGARANGLQPGAALIDHHEVAPADREKQANDPALVDRIARHARTTEIT
jgi:hypothetical protein